MDELFRQPSSAEEKDYINLMQKRNKDPYLQRVREAEQEMTISKKPFCRSCAIADYEDAKQQTAIELSRGATKTIQLPNITDYKKPERFQVLKKTVIPEKFGKETIYVTFTDFRCVKRGCKISIEEKRSDNPEPVSESVVKKK